MMLLQIKNNVRHLAKLLKAQPLITQVILCHLPKDIEAANWLDLEMWQIKHIQQNGEIRDHHRECEYRAYYQQLQQCHAQQSLWSNCCTKKKQNAHKKQQLLNALVIGWNDIPRVYNQLLTVQKVEHQANRLARIKYQSLIEKLMNVNQLAFSNLYQVIRQNEQSRFEQFIGAGDIVDKTSIDSCVRVGLNGALNAYVTENTPFIRSLNDSLKRSEGLLTDIQQKRGWYHELKQKREQEDKANNLTLIPSKS
jgi:hypothetical protein